MYYIVVVIRFEDTDQQWGTLMFHSRKHLKVDRGLQKKEFAYLGVYDGHGGKDAAIYLELELHKRVYNQLDMDNVRDSLREIFYRIDEDIKKIWMTSIGSTAVVVIVVDNKLYCVNVIQKRRSALSLVWYNK